MDKYPLIGVSICAVVLLVLGSLSNVVGYQSVQSLNEQTLNERTNQKELLFQTIVDIANNKEIQRIILKSQSSRERFFNPGVRFPVFSNLVLTKNQIRQMYFLGLILSKVISKTRMQSIIKQYQVSNREVQKEINVVIEKDARLNGEMTQLSTLKCDCGNENISWHFPIICTLLIPIQFILFYIAIIILFVFHTYPSLMFYYGDIISNIWQTLKCFQN